MYEIEQLIGEDKINKALKSFISDWNSKNGSIKTMTDRYATSEDLIAYILRFTPIDELSRVEDLLRCI